MLEHTYGALKELLENHTNGNWKALVNAREIAKVFNVKTGSIHWVHPKHLPILKKHGYTTDQHHSAGYIEKQENEFAERQKSKQEQERLQKLKSLVARRKKNSKGVDPNEENEYAIQQKN